MEQWVINLWWMVNKPSEREIFMKPRSTSPKARANSWSILGKLWTHIQKFKNKFNMFALYQFFFNSLPPSPSYLILFSLLPFLSILFDSYPFSTQLLYIPTSLSFGSYSYFHSLSVANKCLTSFSAFACSLYPICFLSLFPQPLFDAIMQWFPLFSLLPSLSLSLISNNLILFIPIFNST